MKNLAGAFLLAVTFLAAKSLAAPPRDLAADIENAKSAVSNFTADTFVLEQSVGRFQGLVNGEVSDTLASIQADLATLGVSEELQTQVAEQISTSRREVNARLHVVRVLLGDLSDLLAKVRVDLDSDLGAIEADLNATSDLAAEVEMNFEAAEIVTLTEAFLVQMTIVTAIEGQTGPEVEAIEAQLGDLRATLISERATLHLAKGFFDETRDVALEALALVVEGLE